MPEQDKPNTSTPKREPKIEKFKAFGKNWIVGTLVLLAFSIIGAVGNSIGIQTIDIKTIGSVSDLVAIWSQLNWQTGLFVFFAAAGVGAMTWFLVVTSSAWGKIVHLHRDAIIPDEQLNREIKEQLKKMRIVPLVIWIVYVTMITLPVVGGIFVISGINTLNAHDLLKTYISTHYALIAIDFIGGAIIGWIVQHLKGQYDQIYNKIEPYLSRTKVL
jgi:hypothetical protein